MVALIRRLIDNVFVQYVLSGLVYATVLCAWFPLPPDSFWMIVIAWPFIVMVWIYALINGTILGMNL